MKSIEDKIKGINLVSHRFNDLRKEFTLNQQHIVDILKLLIDRYASDYSLTKDNGTQKLKFYSIVFRVKEKDSFAEKLIRNNDYNKFQDKLLDLQNIDEPSLKNTIKEMEDLIGIKVLTDLNVDSINMFRLISSTNFIKEASDKGITIDATDLAKQPVRMKNGLNIFKLRCKYETWNFELQIKSKLESAWGDMEHAIFYKDYKITPVRDLAQQSMIHIGKLLYQIDEYLQEIRAANDNFTLNSQTILFINDFEKNYAKKVAAVLNGINFNFKKIASLSFNIYNIGTDLLKNKELKIKHLDLLCPKYSDYIIDRNKDFDLQIFESILLSTFEVEITEDNIEENLDAFFKLIMESYEKFILENKVVQQEDLAKRYTELFFKTCINNNCKEFILNTKNVFDHVNNIKLIEEIIEVLGLENERIEEILSVYSIFCFNGNLKGYLELIDKDQLVINLENSKNEIQKVKVNENNLSENINSLINIIG